MVLEKIELWYDSTFFSTGNLHYEKVGDNEPVCIEDELPFELPGGWSWARMGAFEKLSNGTSKRHGKDGCETIVLRLADLTEHAISLEDTRRIILTETEREKYRLNPNDIVFIRVNGSKEKVGKAFVVPKSDDDVAYCDHLMRGEPSGALSSDLLCFFLSTAYLHNRIKENVVSAAGQNTISQGSLVSLLIPIPPLAEQQRIVTALDDLLACVDTIEREQAELDELLSKTRSKVLDLAVRGKLVPQDPADEPASVLLERIHQEKLQMVADGKLKKKDIAGDSVIYRGDDNSYYERHGSDDAALLEGALYPIPTSWSWTRLGSISNYGDSSSASSNEIADDDWVLDLEDIEKDTGTIIRRVSKAERSSSSSKRSFVSGQLLYSKLRPYLNKVLIAPDDGYCTSEILPISLYGGCKPEFVMTYLRSPYFLQYANHCSYGVKMPRLGTNDGRKAFVALPPVAEQRRISHMVDSIQNALMATR